MLTGFPGDLGAGSGSRIPRNIAVAASRGDGGQGDEGGLAGWACGLMLGGALEGPSIAGTWADHCSGASGGGVHGLTVCMCEHLESPFSRETVPPSQPVHLDPRARWTRPGFPEGAPSRFTRSRCL